METEMDQDRCWQAVVARDSAQDGRFVYAVATTGVYCRPSCPSRRANRENVRFFALPEAAAEAGFRACRRCRPDLAAAADPQLAAIRATCRRIEAAEDGPPALEELAAAADISPHHLHRLFKRLVGITPRQYFDAHRVDRLKAELRGGEPVTSALYGAGYGSSSRLYEKSDARLGMTPATYRKGGAGVEMAWAVRPSPFGELLVAATERGVSFIGFGDDEAEVVAALETEFPSATLVRDEERLGEWLARVLDYLKGREPHLALPLDIRATAFQRRVWDQLLAIPYGETRSYAEIAAALGQPKAHRAVARACATNPTALAVPCHRAVRSGGALAGYRWGLGRKRRLLDMERQAATREQPDAA